MSPMPRYVVIVPFTDRIHPECERGLRILEKRWEFVIWRVGGCSAIDLARSRLASDAVMQSFESIVWIDSDIGFDAGDVDKLIGHDLPIVAGIYAKKGPRALACQFLPGTKHRKGVRSLIGALVEGGENY